MISNGVKRLKELLFQNRSTRQTVTKNVFWLSIGQIGSRLIRAVIIIYAARILGAAEYGLFSYVLGFAGFFTIFADIGINNLLTRDTANHPERRTEYFSTSFWIKISQIVFTVLLIIFVAPYITNVKGAVYLIPFVAFLVVFDNIREFALAYLRGLEKMEIEAFIVVAMNITIVVAGFIILNFSHTSKALLLSYIASVGLSAVLAVIVIRDKFRGVLGCFNKQLAWKIVNNSWPIAFSSVLGIFMLNTDIVMLGWWRSVAEIGYYSAGQRIIQVLYTIPALLASSLFPTVTRFIGQKNVAKVRNINEKSMSLAFLIALPVIVGGVVLGRPIFELVFGRDYLPGVLGFQILLTTLLLVFPGIFITNLVLAYNLQKKAIYYVAAGSLSNVIFNALLIPRYGIAGSAVSTFIALLLNYGFAWLLVKKTGDFKTLPHLKKIITATIIMGTFSFFLNKLGLNVIIDIIVSAGIYFGALYLLKERILNEVISLFKQV